ncbi:hypothetical protein ACMFMF_006875 [Clarireedia jacksonii]
MFCGHPIYFTRKAKYTRKDGAENYSENRDLELQAIRPSSAVGEDRGQYLSSSSRQGPSEDFRFVERQPYSSTPYTPYFIDPSYQQQNINVVVLPAPNVRYPAMHGNSIMYNYSSTLNTSATYTHPSSQFIRPSYRREEVEVG